MNGHTRVMLVCGLLISLLTTQILRATNTTTLTTQQTRNKNTTTRTLSATKAIAKTIYKPSNTAIVFDIDGVILMRTVSIPTLLWRHKGEIACALFDFSLIKDLLKLLWMTAPVGAYISLFEHKRPALVTPLVQELATSRRLNQKTACIIESLLALGYQLHIGTNETANEFTLNQERFPLFSRFNTYTFSDYKNFPDVTQKPQLRYFERMKDRILAYNKKTTNLIFIDDRTDNVQAARDTGYSGIDFTTPEALKATLVDMGIMPPITAACPLMPSVTI